MHDFAYLFHLFDNVDFSLSLSLSLSLSFSLSLSVYLSVCLSLCLSVSVSPLSLSLSPPFIVFIVFYSAVILFSPNPFLEIKSIQYIFLI